MTLSGATTPGQSRPGSNGIEEVLCIPQRSNITEASPFDCFVSYQNTPGVWVLPLYRKVVSVFYSPSRLGKTLREKVWFHLVYFTPYQHCLGYLILKSVFVNNYTVSSNFSYSEGVLDGLCNRSKWVRTPVTLLRSLSDKYLWERYEPPYPSSFGLNSTTTVLLREWLWR